MRPLPRRGGGPEDRAFKSCGHTRFMRKKRWKNVNTTVLIHNVASLVGFMVPAGDLSREQLAPSNGDGSSGGLKQPVLHYKNISLKSVKNSEKKGVNR